MKLFIPELGTRLKLGNEWTVPIQWEHRNFPLIKYLYPSVFEAAMKIPEAGYLGYWWCGKNESLIKFISENPITVTFPKGTVLEVDRIYIRKGNEKFSSLTFRWRTNGKSPRFWLPLSTVNGLECELDGTNNFEDKYPNGRFTLQRYNGFGISWIRKPSSGGRLTKGVCVSIHADNIIRVEKYQNNSFGKVTHYDSIDKMIVAAKRFEFPDRVIVSFIENFENKAKPEVGVEAEVQAT